MVQLVGGVACEISDAVGIALAPAVQLPTPAVSVAGHTQ